VRYEGSCQRSDEVVLGEIIVLIEGFSRIALWWGLVLVASAFLSSRLCKAKRTARIGTQGGLRDRNMI